MTKRCANGRGCAAFAVLGEPAKLSRYNPYPACSECLLRARRVGAEEEDMRNALRAARKKSGGSKPPLAKLQKPTTSGVGMRNRNRKPRQPCCVW
jgi:hypothetical protein